MTTTTTQTTRTCGDANDDNRLQGQGDDNDWARHKDRRRRQVSVQLMKTRPSRVDVDDDGDVDDEVMRTRRMRKSCDDDDGYRMETRMGSEERRIGGKG